MKLVGIANTLKIIKVSFRYIIYKNFQMRKLCAKADKDFGPAKAAFTDEHIQQIYKKTEDDRKWS